MRFRVSKNVSSAGHNFGAAVPVVTASRERFRVLKPVSCAWLRFGVAFVCLAQIWCSRPRF